jgi:putative flavoprotein involved in K+ transport
VHRVPRVVGVCDGLPVVEGDQTLPVGCVVWCTGCRSDRSWIDLPVIGADGLPVHERGVCRTQPGLYFLGRLFQYSLASSMIHGVGRDAKYVADHLARVAGAAPGLGGPPDVPAPDVPESRSSAPAGPSI